MPPVGASSSSIPLSNPEIIAKCNLDRPCANYPPSIWNDYFLQYASDSLEVDNGMEKNIETLKEEARDMLLISSMEKPLMNAEIIDSIQSLGLSYHFEVEIDQVLKQIHNDYVKSNEITHIEDFHSLTLLFKLLRKHGYPISPNVFNKFKDEKGNFSETLTSDVEGMITLYEACHLSIHGEDILDEALAFTSKHLQSITIESNPFLAAKVNNVLKQCPYRGIPRLEARKFISIYHLHPSHNQVLLNLAKLDFNALQKLHQKEIGNICKWWNNLDVPRNLPYVRNRIVECYLWAASVQFEPQYAKGRSMMGRVAALYTVIDDTFDAYGTIEELELFATAIERWDINCLDDLPRYMQLIYTELFRTYDELLNDEDMMKEGRSSKVAYVKEAFKRVVQTYIVEARWLHKRYVPTTEEHLDISAISTCFIIFIMTSFVCVGDIVTEDIFKWAQPPPKIIKAACLICRLMDDIVGGEIEQKRDHVVSSVDCYMKEHGVSRQEAISELWKMNESAWKDINEECLRPTPVPMYLLIMIMNFARVMDAMFKEDDSFTHCGEIMKECVRLLFVDPVPI